MSFLKKTSYGKKLKKQFEDKPVRTLKDEINRELGKSKPG